MELLVKLGQAAMIVFIIFAVVAVIFMLVLACLYCCVGGGRGGGGGPGPGPYPRSAPQDNRAAHPAQVHQAKPYPKPGTEHRYWSKGKSKRDQMTKTDQKNGNSNLSDLIKCT